MRSLAVKVKMEILKLALKASVEVLSAIENISITCTNVYIYSNERTFYEDNVRRITVGVHDWGGVIKFHEGKMVSGP